MLPFHNMMTFTLSSCVCNYHVYRDVWNPSVGETLNYECEGRNPEDPYAFALQKDVIIIGHIPRTISCVCTLFLRGDGAIQYTVSGPRKYSDDLLQGGLELPKPLYVPIYWTRHCNKEGTSIANR